MPSIKNLKKGLHELIDNVDDEATLAICKQLLEREVAREEDFWDKLSEEEKAGIERGLADVEAGRVSSYEDVRKEIRDKFNI